MQRFRYNQPVVVRNPRRHASGFFQFSIRGVALCATHPIERGEELDEEELFQAPLDDLKEAS